jgi:hypothetical protein
MNAADLARLEVAKRAYRAVEPSAAEVQRAVRKARLALRRPRPRRAWLGKTLVTVVLAMGGLAYANPHTLERWVEDTLRSSKHPSRPSGGMSAAAPNVESPKLPGTVPPTAPSPMTETPLVPVPEATAQGPAETAPAGPGTAATTRTVRPAQRRAPAPVAPSDDVTSTGGSEQRPPAPVDVASPWGHVGTALASGDEQSALHALKELSRSEDPRTRDKADLGRAQLLMASGQRDQACSLARSLTNRRAGGRIERQALVLLKSCTRYNR